MCGKLYIWKKVDVMFRPVCVREDVTLLSKFQYLLAHALAYLVPWFQLPSTLNHLNQARRKESDFKYPYQYHSIGKSYMTLAQLWVTKTIIFLDMNCIFPGAKVSNTVPKRDFNLLKEFFRQTWTYSNNFTWHSIECIFIYSFHFHISQLCVVTSASRILLWFINKIPVILIWYTSIFDVNFAIGLVSWAILNNIFWTSPFVDYGLPA